MDAVRFQVLERAELGDLIALQSLTYEHLRRAIGQLIGSPNHAGDTGEGGLLSKPAATYNSTAGTLALSSFAYLELTRGGATITAGQTATPEARVVRFDSGASAHTNHPIDISAHSALNTSYTVWARFVPVNEDVDARRAWSVSQNTEISVTIATRQRERVEFTVALTSSGRPSDQATVSRWTPLFNYFIDSFSALQITAYYHAFSAADSETAALYGVAADKIDMSAELSEITTAQGAGYGLMQQLSHIRALLYLIQEEGVLDNTTPPASNRWSSGRNKSLRQLDIELNTLETSLAALDTRATTLETQTESSTYAVDCQLHTQCTFNPSTNLATLTQQSYTSSPDPLAANFGLIFDYTHNYTEAGDFTGTHAWTSLEIFLDTLSRPAIQFSTNNPLNTAWILSADIRALGYDSDPDAFNYSSTSNAYSSPVQWRPIAYYPADPTAGATYEEAVMRLGDRRLYLRDGNGLAIQPHTAQFELMFLGNESRPFVPNTAAANRLQTNAAGDYVFHFIFSLRLSNRGNF